MDEIDRILSREPLVRPTSGFSDRVMRAVREEAAAPPPIEFPWRRFLPGALAGVSVVLATFLTLSWNLGGAVIDPASLDAFLEGALLRDLGIAAVALFGSGMIVVLALRAALGNAARF